MNRSLLLFPLLASALTAQVVSPTGYDTKKGTGSLHTPFSASTTFGVCRHQQIHGDLTGTPRTITELSFRRRSGGLTTYEARKVTLELLLGEGSADAATARFADNYAATPTVAIAKRELDVPELVATASPQPFVIELPLDRPFSYSGTLALIWEAKVSKVVRGAVDYPIDALTGSHTTHSGTAYGTGCASNTLAITLADDSGILRLQPAITAAPPAAIGILLLGTTDPDLTIPGFCTKLHSDGALVFSLPRPLANGTIPRFPLLTIPNSTAYTNLTLTHQAFFVDATQSPIPLRATNGVSITVPAPNPLGSNIHRVYLPSSTTGPEGTILYGEGAITRFE